jgi:hypothetical protein
LGQIALEQELMLRHRLASLGIRLDRARVNAHLLGDPDEEIVEHFKRLLGGETAREAHKSHLVGKAQPVVDATTVGDLGMVSRRKPDTLGDEIAGIVESMEHRTILLRRNACEPAVRVYS